MSATLNELVRKQILAESHQIEDPHMRKNYIDWRLLEMNNVELLERISDALYQVTEGLSVRLGL